MKVENYINKFNSPELSGQFYILGNYVSLDGRNLKMYWITEKGVAQLLGGYNASVPIAFELNVAYINEFDRMKQYIKSTNSIEISEDMLLSRAVLVATKKIEQLENKVKEMQPKAEYTEKVLDSEGLCTTTQIGKDVGLTARALNNLLSEYKIQYKQGKQWFLYAKYQNLGYTKSATYYDENTDTTYQTTKWTEKGRKFILDFLQRLGYKLQNEVD